MISIFYYFGWIKAAWFESWSPPAAGAAATARPLSAGPKWVGVATLALLTFATLLLGFFQVPLTSWLLP